MTPTITGNIRAAAKRALMAGSTEYFSWTEEAQENFRATAGEEARCRMQQVLLKQVLRCGRGSRGLARTQFAAAQ